MGCLLPLRGETFVTRLWNGAFEPFGKIRAHEMRTVRSVGPRDVKDRRRLHADFARVQSAPDLAMIGVRANAPGEGNTMKKVIGIVQLVAGLAGVGLGLAYTASSSSGEDCARFRKEALDLADQAVAAGEGTPRSQELMSESTEKTDWADMACNTADGMRRDGLMISGAGLLVLLVGLVLFVKARKAAPSPTA
jgi:hypothetical protein